VRPPICVDVWHGNALYSFNIWAEAHCGT
jgi:hypothetical protein